VYLVPIDRRCFFKRHVIYSPSTSRQIRRIH
jgi:hypothetical protein